MSHPVHIQTTVTYDVSPTTQSAFEPERAEVVTQLRDGAVIISIKGRPASVLEALWQLRDYHRDPAVAEVAARKVPEFLFEHPELGR